MTTFYCSNFEHDLLSKKPNSSAQCKLDTKSYQAIQPGQLNWQSVCFIGVSDDLHIGAMQDVCSKGNVIMAKVNPPSNFFVKHFNKNETKPLKGVTNLQNVHNPLYTLIR